MLDFADAVAINKFDRRGAEDALRDVRRQLVRNREAFGSKPDEMPVFGTVASRFNDDGVTALYQHLRGLLAEHGPAAADRGRAGPGRRQDQLGGVADRAAGPGRATWPRSPTTVRTYHERTAAAVAAARRCSALETARELLAKRDEVADCHRPPTSTPPSRKPTAALEPGDRKLLDELAGRRRGRTPATSRW